MEVGVIGGGASGMTAAIFAARSGAHVTVLEHTGRVGKKILSTGNGKCNFTNQKLSKDDYHGNHPSFAEPVLQKFGPEAAVDFFESCGMFAASKRDGYFYPATGQAATVLNVLRYQLQSLGVLVMTDQYIEWAKKGKDGIFCVKTKEKMYHFDRLILACGGKAAPATGSDGSGYRIAEEFGHRVIKPLPVLTYLRSKEPFLKELAGVRCQAEISLLVQGKIVQREAGELQLNKDNLSGIPVFQLSHQGILAVDQKKKTTLLVDFLPGYSSREIENKVLKLMDMYGNLPVSEVLGGMLHKKICGAILHKAGISFDKTVGTLTGKETKQIVSLSKEFEFEIVSFPGFEAAQATQGGVDVAQIDENMMSRKVDGLYFAGEILDVDGRCGGYNLHWAWSSGYVAGCHSVNGEVKCYKSASVG
nr:NAD(P)/FAD-dependent oxidoreductase [Lachnospiraceae bacterium]